MNKSKQKGLKDSDYEFLHRQMAEGHMMSDKSNLPPIILPQIPHKMRANASQENSRVIMETIII